jgi:organic radical activating enzyme
MKAPIREIFCSIQGEGPYTGVRQAFVRFAGCNLECVYCDTPVDRTEHCRVEQECGTQNFKKIDNPLGGDVVSEIIRKYEGLHSVSLTGGEPLLYTNFIQGFSPGIPLYLESNMSLPERAKEVADMFKYVAGDFKLKAGYELKNYDEYFDDMVECFRVLRNNKKRDCFCKIVILDGFDMENLLEGVSKIKDFISMVVLQPVTPSDGNDARPVRVEKMMEIQKTLQDIKETRVMSQSHVMWGAL